MRFYLPLRQANVLSKYNNVLSKYIDENINIVNSTLFQGTLYEYVVMRELHEKLYMEDINKVGGAHDGGVDLTAKWNISQMYRRAKDELNLSEMYPLDRIPKRIRFQNSNITPLIHKVDKENDPNDVKLNALVQCKAFNKSKVTPREFRELIGTYISMIPRRKWKSSVMLMCSPHLLTSDGLKLINSLEISLIYLKINQLSRLETNKFDLVNSGKIENYYENDFASKLLMGCGVKECLKAGLYNE